MRPPSEVESYVNFHIERLLETRDRFTCAELVILVQAEFTVDKSLIYFYIRKTITSLVKESRLIYSKSGHTVSYIVMK